MLPACKLNENKTKQWFFFFFSYTLRYKGNTIFHLCWISHTENFTGKLYLLFLGISSSRRSQNRMNKCIWDAAMFCVHAHGRLQDRWEQGEERDCSLEKQHRKDRSKKNHRKSCSGPRYSLSKPLLFSLLKQVLRHVGILFKRINTWGWVVDFGRGSVQGIVYAHCWGTHRGDVIIWLSCS